MMRMKKAVVLVALALLVSQQSAAFAPVLLSRISSRSELLPHSRSVVVLSSSSTMQSPSSSSSKQQDADDANFSSLDKPKVEKESFDWFQQWYPLVPVDMLNPEVPHKFQLLGQDIVVWNDGAVGDKEYARKTSKKKNAGGGRRNGTWRAFADECPHRKVPLSEGRVENDGTLLCSYHGWRFQGEAGKCVSVPQVIDSPTEHERIISNAKTSCQVHPTRLVDGVLYVWASRDANASIQAALTPITLNYKLPVQDNDSGGTNSESKVDKDRVLTGQWSYRELPYGADFFVENAVDPSHVPVSHHNIAGSRYNEMTMRMGNFKSLNKSGFTIEVSTPATTSKNSTTTFIAPGAVHVETPIEGAGKGAVQVLEMLVSPSRPGFCHHVGRLVVIKGEDGNDDGKKAKMLPQYKLPTPKWFRHIMASAFWSQDALFLHHQERTLHETGQYSSVGSYFDPDRTTGSSDNNADPASYTKTVYPVRTDRGVLNFRNWLARYTPDGKIPYKLHNPTMPPADNSIVFDVWNAHTKHCSYCQDAVRRLKKIRFLTITMTLCCAVLRPFGKVPSLVATLSTAGIGYLLHKLIGMFYKHEFSHGQND